jgi:prepilin-type N-terminal cleavage/methylation domain-containing protein
MRRSKLQNGFTLLEVIIAIAILAMALSGIIIAEHRAIDTVYRTKRQGSVSMLASLMLAEAEKETQGRTFNEVRDDIEGKFEAPFAEFSYQRKIRTIKFPNLLEAGATGEDGKAQETTDTSLRVVKIATNFLSKSTREVVVTIKWKENGEDQSYSVAEYWVDFNHAFQMQE